ncbi:site-2 protease family protein [Candidatus Comchoanobacter bicostacola]|uniref:Site-2 protease family protein n=1 Tax=Candidatus Comchoanobacter bicostacola TaxID=2919598 RepID=A0ABY5DJQ7_9GAMM|nr:site-2 protease family protein [Candidatus Comchoanobacter bicostacola]UTC24751.1 site-2 protease family protein [Candidatus Comchoanobacter bicostacola]
MTYSQNWLFELTLWVIPVLLAVKWRESAKAIVSHYRGDSTAKMLGLGSINIFKNLDPIGSVIAPFLLILKGQLPFGWARSFSIRPYFLNRGKFDVLIIILSGFLANILMAIGWLWVDHLSTYIEWSPKLYTVLTHSAQNGIKINCMLIIAHCIPIFPMDIAVIIDMFLPRSLSSLYKLTEWIGPYVIFFIIFSNMYPQELIANYKAVKDLMIQLSYIQ